MFHKVYCPLASLILALAISFAGFTPALAAPPDVPTLITPTGDIGMNYSPSFVWNEVTGATDYHLWVNGPSGTALDQSYQASDICNSGTCTVQSPVVLGSGAYTWWVQASNADGLGPWSSGMSFSITISLPSPPNDNFADAVVISTLPFNDIVDITDATLEFNEPSACDSLRRSIWYTFTPTADMMVTIDMMGSNFEDTTLSVYKGADINNLDFLMCTNWWGNPITLHVQAETTYYIRAGDMFYSGGGDELHLNMQAIPPPPNDNFADAKVITSLSFDDSADTIAAEKETGEPKPSCASDSWDKTIWYAFTPTTSGSLIANFPWVNFSPVLAVYTGNALTNLTELGCRLGDNLAFHADAGTTYYFQVGGNWNDGGPVGFHLDIAPPPTTWFWFTPSDPSVFDTIQFNQSSYDPAGVGFKSFAWDFGDGTTSSEWYPTHKYAGDGDYTVQLTVTTYDDRTASASQVVPIRTHDVAVTKISAPQSANSGQTRSITVYVNNKRYGETVRVDLYKSGIYGFEWIGYYIQFVPVRPANRTTPFTFNYTFTNSDAKIGKITFKTTIGIIDARDAWLADNELMSSPPTKVPR